MNLRNEQEMEDYALRREVAASDDDRHRARLRDQQRRAERRNSSREATRALIAREGNPFRFSCDFE